MKIIINSNAVIVPTVLLADAMRVHNAVFGLEVIDGSFKGDRHLLMPLETGGVRWQTSSKKNSAWSTHNSVTDAITGNMGLPYCQLVLFDDLCEAVKWASQNPLTDKNNEDKH